jgi:serine phosphatase RsbU (regulator of sigma subunit)/pSer/pThr/pTyr-binding forkhead associated (FHA) protein
MATTQVKTIKLDVLAGPPVDPILVSSNKPHVIGRGNAADIRLLDETVSRRHAQFWLAADTWLMSDLGSRHGTSLNGVRLPAEQALPIKENDLISLGPWTFVVRTGHRHTTTGFLTTQDDVVAATRRVQRVPQAELTIKAQAKLDLIAESAATIAGAINEAALAATTIDAAAAGTGVARVAFLRHINGQDVDLIASRGPVSGPRGGLDFSRSLLRAAAEGNVVRLDNEAQPNFGQSIVQLGIHSAICAPVMVGGTPAGYLYLDSRAGESAVASDAAAFCHTIARIAGLALANLRTREIRERQEELQSDLEAAHEAQVRLLPSPRGRLNRVGYAMRSIPGRHVAGDLFGALAIDGERTAVFLGDVSGKGVGAALLMATAKAHLDASLKHHGDAARAVTEANHYVGQHCVDGKFISLWLGVFTPRSDGTTELAFIDAGHGYWLVRDADGSARRASYQGGLPLGVDGEARYDAETMILQPRARVVVYSDGVVEQQSPEGIDFGVDRAIQTLEPCGDVETDVEALVRGVIDFAHPPTPGSSSGSASRSGARTTRLADDVTVASIIVG